MGSQDRTIKRVTDLANRKEAEDSERDRRLMACKLSEADEIQGCTRTALPERVAVTRAGANNFNRTKMDKSQMYRVYPTEWVSGFTHVYCETEQQAWEEKDRWDSITGVEWAIEYPERERNIHNLLACLEDARIYMSRLDMDTTEITAMIGRVTNL